MNTSDSYLRTAQAYAEGVRGLFVPAAAPPAPEFAIRGSARVTVLAGQAEKLVPLSADLTATTAAQLTHDDVAVRAEASIKLLAQAMTDLEISAYLLKAAQDEEEAPSAQVERERSAAAPVDVEPYLQLLLRVPGAVGRVTERAAPSLPADLPAARTLLAGTVEDALTLIRDRSARTGQAALGGLLVLGVGQVAQATGIVGMNIAQALGQADKVTRLYSLFREFALNAYNSLVALLGPALAQTAAKQVLAWVNDMASGAQFGKLLDQLYETGKTEQHLKQVTDSSQASLEKFVTAFQGVDKLNDQYQQQIGLIEKLLRGLRLLGSVPAAALPQGTLLLAATYIVLGGYVILAGADYVDAQKLAGLGRVPGVRKVVESNLASA